VNIKTCNPRRHGNWLLIWVSFAVLLILSSSHTGSAQENLLLHLEELQSSAELALYFAKATVLATNEADARINLEALLELFVPPSSDQQSGLLEQSEHIGSSLEQSGFSSLVELDLSSAISSVAIYLSLAERAVMTAQAADASSLLPSARQAYAYLLAALGSDESGFGLAGIRQMIQWLPDSAIWLSPENSIQEAIDRVLAGGTIHLAPGTYTLATSLRIGKPLTITKDNTLTGAILLVCPDVGAAIYVGNDTPEVSIDIHIRDLAVQGGPQGITVGMSGDTRWGANTRLTLTRVDILDCSKSGVTIVSNHVILQGCEIRRNGEFGILVPQDGIIEIVQSTVAENGTLELAAIPYRQTAGIHAPERAVLSIIESTVEANAGAGIHVGNQVQLILARSQIIGNGSDGLLVWDQATIHLEENTFLNNGQTGIRFSDLSCPHEGNSGDLHAFTGSVTGWGNSFPTSNDPSICPLDSYRYLLNPHL
jgi:Right handed beta helix region